MRSSLGDDPAHPASAPCRRRLPRSCRLRRGATSSCRARLLEQIVARSDGVPLFVEELAAAALETGQVDPGASTDVGAGGHGVPSALYDS